MATVLERTLWDCYLILKFHGRQLPECVRDAPILDDERKQLIYGLDYADLYAYSFPWRDVETEDRDLGNPFPQVAVKSLWEELFGYEPDHLPVLALAPGYRLEILDVLRHREYSVKAARGFFPRGVHGRTSNDLRREVRQSLQFGELRARLGRLLTEKGLTEDIRTPVTKIVDLLDRGVLLPYEVILGDTDYEKILTERSPEPFKEMHRYYKQHAFDLSEHDRFHEDIDRLNIELIHDTQHALRQQGKYAALVTHSFHTLNAGTKVAFTDEAGSYSLVRHSVTPLYLLRARRIEDGDSGKRFLKRGLRLLTPILEELEQCSIIQDLKATSDIAQNALAKRLSENRLVKLPAGMYDMIDAFAKGFFVPLNPSYEQRPGQTFEADEEVIEEILGLEFNWKRKNERKEEAAATIQTAAKDIARRAFPFASCLTELYLPVDSYRRYVDLILEWCESPVRA